MLIVLFIYSARLAPETDTIRYVHDYVYLECSATVTISYTHLYWFWHEKIDNIPRASFISTWQLTKLVI